MIAAGAYLRRLRDQQNLSRKVVAQMAGTSASQVERIENGDQETRGSLLLALVRALKGSVDQLTDLLLDPAATKEIGEERADQWLSETAKQEIAAKLSTVPTDRTDELITILKAMQQRLDSIEDRISPDRDQAA